MSETLKKFVSLIENIIDNGTLDWINDATIEDVAFALDCGYKSAIKLKKYKNQEKVEKPKPVENIVVSSFEKGKLGELEIEAIIKDNYPSVINTSGIHKSGDLNLFINNNKIMVEIKNYTNAVPYTNVEKFKRDLHLTNSLGGIFISLNSNISKISKTMSILYENGIPCIYVVSRDPDVILCCISLIASAIEAQIYKNNSLTSKDLLLIDNGVCNMRKNKDTLNEMSNNLHKEITKISSLLSTTESDLKKIFDKIQNNIPMEVININDIFTNNKYVSSYDSVIKSHLSRILNKCPTDWKQVGNGAIKYKNTLNIEIKCNKNYPDITFLESSSISNIEAMTNWEANKSLITLGKHINIIISDNTIDWILNILQSITSC